MMTELRCVLSILILSFGLKATTLTLTDGSASPVPGATDTSLDNGLPSNFHLLGLNAGIQFESLVDVCREPNSNGAYMYVGPDSVISATFFGGISYLGFNWGSVDSYNTLTLVDANGSSTVYGQGGESIPGLLIDQSSSRYVNFFANGPSIVYATWTSTAPAFEFAGIATLATDPESPPQNPTPELPCCSLTIIGLAATLIGVRRSQVSAIRRKGGSACRSGFLPGAPSQSQ